MKTRRRSLRASTLTELLVVMILSGVVLMGVFDGLSLFDTLRRRLIGGMEGHIARMEGLYRLETLLAAADSARVERGAVQLYRRGDRWRRLTIADSLLSADLGAGGRDTLLGRIASWRTVAAPEGGDRIDSLILVREGVELRLGLGASPHRHAAAEMELLEKQYRDEDR